MLREKETETEFDKMIKEVKLRWEKQQPKLASYIEQEFAKDELNSKS